MNSKIPLDYIISHRAVYLVELISFVGLCLPALGVFLAVSSAGILTALGILLLSICMLRGIYGRWAAILGIISGAVGMVFEALQPHIGMLYALYGILLPIWFGAVGLGQFRLGFKFKRVFRCHGPGA